MDMDPQAHTDAAQASIEEATKHSPKPAKFYALLHTLEGMARNHEIPPRLVLAVLDFCDTIAATDGSELTQ